MNYMNQALRARNKSKAKLAKVGAVLVINDEFYGPTFNAWNSDFENKLDVLENEVDGKLITKPEVMHAEEIVIAMAARYGAEVNDAELYVTLAPCFKCVRLIIASGIKKVYYKDEWWDKNALEYLKKYVKVERV